MRSRWKISAKAWLITAGLADVLMTMAGAVAPAMAQEGLEKDFGIVRACAEDIWHFCAAIPGSGRIQDCIQEKMGQFSKTCLNTLLDAMAGASFKIWKDQTYALCAAARCNVYDGVA